MKASIFSLPVDLEDAPIFQRPIPFRPNWRPFDRPLSESEKFFLWKIERQSSGTPISNELTGIGHSQSIGNDASRD